MFLDHNPGRGNARHYHVDEDEFRVVLKGRIRWTFDDEVADAKPGDIVFCARGRRHAIEVLGAEPGVRFAVANPHIGHVSEAR